MTFVRMVRFTLSSASRDKAQTMADDLVSAIKEQPGSSGASFGGNDDGECGLCVFWESQEQADAAAAVISPRLDQHLAGNVTGAPDIHLLPILASCGPVQRLTVWRHPGRDRGASGADRGVSLHVRHDLPPRRPVVSVHRT